MRKNKIPKKARYERSVMKALEFIKVYDIYWLPVEPQNIFKQMRNFWALYSVVESEKVYSARNPFGVSVERGVDAKTYQSPDGKYIVIYDDKTLSERIRWTLTHEIAHIYLDHFEEFNLTVIDRSDNVQHKCLTQEEYDVLEREADIFTAEILSPMVILQHTNINSPEDLCRVCLLSGIAAKNREIDIKYRGKKLIYKYLLEEYLEQFSIFLSPIAFCSNADIDTPRRLINYHEKVSIVNGKELFAKVDEEGRFWECPKCNNTDFSPHALYCKMCGTYLYNECKNYPDNYDIEYCGKRNPGDARHCEYCGHETYLLKAGLIMSWDELVAEHGSVMNGTSNLARFELKEEKSTSKDSTKDPFGDGKPMEISDDDLPF